MRARIAVPLLAALACGAGLVAPAARAGQPSLPDRLGSAMRPAGAASGALIVDADTGRRLYALRADVRRMPASVEKLWTTSTALRELGARTRLWTRILSTVRPDASGTLRGDVWLRGGGDPSLGLTGMRRLARAVRTAGVRRITGAVAGDESLFDRRRGVPSSYFAPSPDVEPLSALAYRRDVFYGRYVSRPALRAAQALTVLLNASGVRVGRAAREGVAPRTARPLASLASPTIATLVRMTNGPSDNFYAETLLKDLGARVGTGGTSAAGAAVVRAAAAAIGRHPSVLDGSGLSRRDRSSPADVVALLREMRDDPDFVGSLAVAGRTGTLWDRMRGTAAAGRCRAKTGSLHDVSALAGYCRTLGGRRLAFAILMNGIRSVPAARRLQDRMATAVVAGG